MALFLWENKKEEEQLAQISRNESLSRLPLRLSTNRVVELVQLRDTVRPVSTNTYFFHHLCWLDIGAVHFILYICLLYSLNGIGQQSDSLGFRSS